MFLNNDSVDAYLQLPDFIYNVECCKIIDFTALSDLARPKRGERSRCPATHNPLKHSAVARFKFRAAATCDILEADC
jgi:hypothetical protein